MKSLLMNAQGAGSNSTHKYPWKWCLTDLKSVEKNDASVFSCFSCGGGSSMGYKLAGYRIVGNCEIDPRVLELYKANLHPEHAFLMDIRDFVQISQNELPHELHHLDILDGSPPCSTFSMAGDREKAWGKAKAFREGQKKQRLDDLFFHFIDVAQKLQPKIVVAENVKGLLAGNAKGYVNEILHALDVAGYETQIFLLNAACMGVPQTRERCFFIARRKDLQLPPLSLAFDEPQILFGEVRTADGIEPEEGVYKDLMRHCTKSDRCIADISMRVRGKCGGYTNPILQDHMVAQTLVSSGNMYRAFDRKKPSRGDIVSIQTFPQDYDFKNQSPQYVCGMSVPPVMMAQIASQIWVQWLEPLKEKSNAHP